MFSARFLYLHNGSRPAGPSQFRQQLEAAGFTLDTYWAYDGDFPRDLTPYQGVFLSGSPHGAYEDIPFIQREHELIAAVAARRLPTLGVCFGSQILASALCGRDQVFRRESCEVGFMWLDLTAAAATDPLTCDLPNPVRNFVWHNDEVRAEHPDMTILASSSDCANQIWRYRDLPIWGIQGHPEVSLTEALRWFDDDRNAFERDGADIVALKAAATEQSAAKRMLANFIAICQTSAPVPQ